MSALKRYWSTKMWDAKVCLCKNVQVQYYSKSPTAKHFFAKNLEKINKYNHLMRFYTSNKCEKNINVKRAVNNNTNEKFQRISSVATENNELDYHGKLKRMSVGVIGGCCTTLSTCILLKQNPSIKEIRLIDTDNSMRLSICDVRQIDTATKIRHYERNFILDGLRDIDIAVLMDETNSIVGNKETFSQFVSSSNFAQHMAECMASTCPNALIAIFTHPVTAIVPLISEIYKKYNIYNPSKIIGSAALNSMKINASTANFLNLSPSCVKVPISGGVDSLTHVPLLSKASPFDRLSIDDQHTLINCLKTANNNLLEDESTLSAGLAAAKFISTLIYGMQNNTCVANAFVRSNIYPSCQYMTSEIQFGPFGIQKIYGLPKISPNEVFLIEQSVPIINRIVDSAKHFAETGNIK